MGEKEACIYVEYKLEVLGTLGGGTICGSSKKWEGAGEKQKNHL